MIRKPQCISFILSTQTQITAGLKNFSDGRVAFSHLKVLIYSASGRKPNQSLSYEPDTDPNHKVEVLPWEKGRDRERESEREKGGAREALWSC